MLVNSANSKKMFSILYSDDEDDEEEDMHYKSEVVEEMSCVGAGIGGGHRHSSELKVLNHKQVMKSNEEKERENEIEKEHKIIEN